ncbi:hypothetical protein [Kamptonema formosum]|nr:hypothetical protein [Oscillatoria sp. PCC 10802]
MYSIPLKTAINRRCGEREIAGAPVRAGVLEAFWQASRRSRFKAVWKI